MYNVYCTYMLSKAGSEKSSELAWSNPQTLTCALPTKLPVGWLQILGRAMQYNSTSLIKRRIKPTYSFSCMEYMYLLNVNLYVCFCIYMYVICIFAEAG